VEQNPYDYLATSKPHHASDMKSSIFNNYRYSAANYPPRSPALVYGPTEGMGRSPTTDRYDDAIGRGIRHL
jgi:hypothetical protein